MEESVRSTALLVLVVSASSIVHAQDGGPFSGSYQAFESNELAKASGCINAVNKALMTDNGYAYNTSYPPFSLAIDGKTNVMQQDRIISRETKGDTETVEYKSNEILSYENGKPVYDNVRKIVIIKRKDGQIVAVTHPQDMKRQAEARAAVEKMAGKKMDLKMLKSVETTFKARPNGGCETDQKAFVVSKDEKGSESETQVTYDSAFCDGLKPTIARVGANNAAECGALISSAERVYKERSKALKAEGKKFVASGLMDGNEKESAKFANSTLTMSMAISLCIQEQQSSMGGMGAMGMGGIGSVVGGMGYSGASGGLFAPTEPAKAKPSVKKVNPAVQ